MKKLFFTLLPAVTFCATIFAQKITTDKIPSLISTAFKTKFPDASVEIWEVEKKGIYEVEFFNEEKRMAAEFDKSGKWLKTQYGIKLTQLPNAVTEALSKHFQAYKLIGAIQLITPAKGTTYELVTMKGKKRYQLQFTISGKLLEKEMEKEKDGDD